MAPSSAPLWSAGSCSAAPANPPSTTSRTTSPTSSPASLARKTPASSCATPRCFPPDPTACRSSKPPAWSLPASPARPTPPGADLLTALDPQVPEHLAGSPWDAEGDTPLPCACKPDGLAIQTSAVRTAAQRVGCTFQAVAATILPPIRYNALLARTDNKATINWMATTWLLNRLLQQAAAIAPAEPVFAVLDRQGGRTDYRPALQQSFDPAEMTVLEQTPERGRYRMRLSNQSVDLTFMMDADLQCCVTAWGSIIAKYTREICMARLNDWWRTRVDNLEPTAGYLPDGRRFADQVVPHFERLGVNAETMIRCR